MCIFCSGEPVDEDPRKDLNSRQWETSMMDACCNNPAGCCLAIIGAPCFACYLRYIALNRDMTKYLCCQGFLCGDCLECIGCQSMARSCPWPCLFTEVILCESCAISTTRIYVQVERQITTDPCDNRIIRFNNCVQLLACICHILGQFIDVLRLAAQILDLIADIVYCIVQACMQSQTHLELKLHPTATDYGASTSTVFIQQQPGY